MKKQYLLFLLSFVAFAAISFRNIKDEADYHATYTTYLERLQHSLSKLLENIKNSDLKKEENSSDIKKQIAVCRNHLKAMDFWMRYLEPISYKQINGPLPVEWETEVFEKFEKPYKREGAGLTLAELYLEEKDANKSELYRLIDMSFKAAKVYQQDSITKHLKDYHHFFLCNRLHLLNLASIYTTAFECPDTSHVIPELRTMLLETQKIYISYNKNFTNNLLSDNYLSLYQQTINFANSQPDFYSNFDHFTFIKSYINPLYKINQELIRTYKVVTRSYVDYTLSKNSTSIFDKSLYNGQNAKGIFLRVQDKSALQEIDRVGKMLFYDPILSGNNQRSCVSCHKSTEYFTDTIFTTSLQFDRKTALARNTPTLINAGFNHLLMMDGKHTTLQSQAKGVITNKEEMASTEEEVLQRVLSCEEYEKSFKKLLKLTPQEKEVTFDHIASAITLFYSKFSNYYAPFDEAMNDNNPISPAAIKGFNLSMSKAQCATCHFVPQFNGVKPPFVNSEFEVIGVPHSKNPKMLNEDMGRYTINEAVETRNAFRTGSLRNAQYTRPYMHNGVFNTLAEVVDFYDAGGGVGRGLEVKNQTLSSDSLHLSKTEKNYLIQFIASLNEKIQFESFPDKLPNSKIKNLNNRKVGGEY